MTRMTSCRVLQVQNEAGSMKVTLLTELKECGRTQNWERGKQVHAEAVECGYDTNTSVANAILNMYAKCGRMAEAQRVLDSMRHPTLVSWNVVILGYAANGQCLTALEVFTRMTMDTAPDSVTFLAALKACTSLALSGNGGASRVRGRAMHNLVVEMCCDSDVFVQNTLIDMYAKCGCMAEARLVFDGMQQPDGVSWTVLLMGYADNGQGLVSLDLFTKMKPAMRTSVTFLAALKACVSLEEKTGDERWQNCKTWGKAIHNLATENAFVSNIHVQSILIDMYAKCGSMKDARYLFDSMKHPNVVCWTVLIMGYADNGQGLTALKLFTSMKSRGPVPNSVTFVAALKACALVGALEIGRTIHSEINRRNEMNGVLVNCLVDFYAKCGSLEEARSVFDVHSDTRNTITWTALLAGFSNCGDVDSVFRLFEAMQDAGFAPNSVTFLLVLTCCSHGAFVEKGKQCFDSISTRFGMSPTVKQYNCMLDIFGRANKLNDAMALLQRMSCSPNEVTWRTILGACRKWKNLELGRLAFQSLLNYNEKNAAAHVLMGHLYASRGMLQEQEMVMELSKQIRGSTIAGEAYWTTEDGDVHVFSEM